MAAQAKLDGTDEQEADGILSVIIAARNEEAYIGPCLQSLLDQDDSAGTVEVILAANACTDRTVDVAAAYRPGFDARGWSLVIVDVPRAGKVNALNAGDSAAKGNELVFLDADVRLDSGVLGQIRLALATSAPRYATGTLNVAPAKTWITRRYARFWTRLPFVQGGAVGAGLFAVNRAGRGRWGEFPDIISDDTYVRLLFTPDERIEVPARYHWPMVEGFANLVKVRRRQDAGVREIHRLYPDMPAREGKARVTRTRLARLFLTMPVSFLVYAGVHVAVRLRGDSKEWNRGR